MKNYIILGLFFAIILAISIIIGFYLYKLDKAEEQIAFDAQYEKIQSEATIKKAEDLIKETSSIENKTTPNTKVIKKIYYKDCNHLIKTEEKIKTELVNKSEAEFQIEYIGWEIQKFSPTEIVIYKEINDFCNQHYLVIEELGKIVVYKLDKYGKKSQREKETAIQTIYLSAEDIKELQEGIMVYSNEELQSVIEDYE